MKKTIANDDHANFAGALISLEYSYEMMRKFVFSWLDPYTWEKGEYPAFEKMMHLPPKSGGIGLTCEQFADLFKADNEVLALYDSEIRVLNKRPREAWLRDFKRHYDDFLKRKSRVRPLFFDLVPTLQYKNLEGHPNLSFNEYLTVIPKVLDKYMNTVVSQDQLRQLFANDYEVLALIPN